MNDIHGQNSEQVNLIPEFAGDQIKLLRLIIDLVVIIILIFIQHW